MRLMCTVKINLHFLSMATLYDNHVTKHPYFVEIWVANHVFGKYMYIIIFLLLPTDTEEDDWLIGPKPDKPSKPEPLTRDDSLKKGAPMRDWDRGKPGEYLSYKICGSVLVYK